jgi:hypothetical protein
MNDFHPDDEPLLDGLAELPAGAWDLPGGDGAFKQQLLAETTAVVRSRGRRKRVRRYAGFALAYAAGIATATVVWPRPEALPRRVDAVVESAVAGEESRRRETPPTGAERRLETPPTVNGRGQEIAAVSPAPASATAAADPVALRRQVAAAPPAEQIALLRRAGDLYLGRYGDLESALDCYRQVLELTPASERGQFDAGDSWLLAELKHAQSAPAVAYVDQQ